MLPGFLSAPHDLETAFGALARTLGQALVEREDLQSIICHGLRIAISRSCHEGAGGGGGGGGGASGASGGGNQDYDPVVSSLWRIMYTSDIN